MYPEWSDMVTRVNCWISELHVTPLWIHYVESEYNSTSSLIQQFTQVAMSLHSGYIMLNQSVKDESVTNCTLI
jgi:hypothetical protein